METCPVALKHCKLPALLVLILAVVQGCSTTAAVEPSAAESAAPLQPDADKEQKYPIRPFPVESLYQLLVGELAGVRGDFDLALEKYVAQAEQTRDPGVTARAARIAAYRNALPELLDMSTLWAQLEPDNLEARRLAALSLTQSGRLREAFAHVEYLLQAGNAEPLMTLAVLGSQASREDREFILLQYPRLETEWPDNETVLLSKAMLLRQQGDLEEALKSASQLVEIAPDKEPGLLLKAQLLHQRGAAEKAVRLLETAINIHPESRRLRLQYIRFLAEQDVGKAREQLEQLVKQYPDDLSLKFSLAKASEEIGLLQEAERIYLELTHHSKAANEAHFQLARMAETNSNIENALSHYRQVHDGSKFLAASARISQLLARSNQLDTARLYLQKLRLEKPDQAVSIYQIESELLLENQRQEDAYNILSDAISQHPDTISLLYTRSMLSEQQNNIAQSERDLRAILAVDAENAMALNALGYTLTVHTNRYEEAHQLILHALELNPEDPATIDSLGWVLYQLGNYEDALVQLRLAMSRLPDPEVAAHLGEVLWAIGEKEEAMGVWQEALKLDPENQTIQNTMDRLQATQEAAPE